MMTDQKWIVNHRDESGNQTTIKVHTKQILNDDIGLHLSKCRTSSDHSLEYPDQQQARFHVNHLHNGDLSDHPYPHADGVPVHAEPRHAGWKLWRIRASLEFIRKIRPSLEFIKECDLDFEIVSSDHSSSWEKEDEPLNTPTIHPEVRAVYLYTGVQPIIKNWDSFWASVELAESMEMVTNKYQEVLVGQYTSEDNMELSDYLHRPEEGQRRSLSDRYRTQNQLLVHLTAVTDRVKNAFRQISKREKVFGKSKEDVIELQQWLDDEEEVFLLMKTEYELWKDFTRSLLEQSKSTSVHVKSPPAEKGAEGLDAFYNKWSFTQSLGISLQDDRSDTSINNMDEYALQLRRDQVKSLTKELFDLSMMKEHPPVPRHASSMQETLDLMDSCQAKILKRLDDFKTKRIREEDKHKASITASMKNVKPLELIKLQGFSNFILWRRSQKHLNIHMDPYARCEALRSSLTSPDDIKACMYAETPEEIMQYIDQKYANLKNLLPLLMANIHKLPANPHGKKRMNH